MHVTLSCLMNASSVVSLRFSIVAALSARCDRQTYSMSGNDSHPPRCDVMMVPLGRCIGRPAPAPRVGGSATDADVRHKPLRRCCAQEKEGRYGAKWCILALKEVGGRRKDPLGRVVLDLAEFGHATGGQAQHSFEIACAPDVAAAAGPLPPRMLITLG